MNLQFTTMAVPVASEGDAEVTCRAIRPFLSEGTEVIIIYVIEKGAGGIDPAPLELQKERANRFFERCSQELADCPGSIDHTICFHTAVVEGILHTATEREADVIPFTPRSVNRLLKFATGDTTFNLVHRADRPILILPSRNIAEPA
jgi:hypothetical protein